MAHRAPEPPPPEPAPASSQRAIFAVTFWADAIERAISAAAASALTVLTIGGADPDLITAPWLAAASVAGGTAILDLLRSLAAARRGNPGTASMTHATRADVPPQFIARFHRGH